MELREYLAHVKSEQGICAKFVCKKMNITEPTLRKVLRGYPINIETLRKIVEGTNGNVSYMELINLYLRNIRPTLPKKDIAFHMKEEA